MSRKSKCQKAYCTIFKENNSDFLKMIQFRDMLKMIDVTLIFCGLSDVYLKKSRNSKSFLIFQRILFITGFLHMIPLMTGEVISAVKLALDKTTNDDNSFLKISELIPCFIVSFFSVVKSFTMVYKKEAIRNLVADIKNMWPKNAKGEIKMIVLKSMVPTKQFCWVYTIVTNVLSLVYNIFPLIVMLMGYMKYGSTNMHLPYFIWYPFDWSTNSLKYTVTYLSQFYAGVFTTSAVSSVDCFFCLLVAHICMHFKFLCRDIERITRTQGLCKTDRDYVCSVRLKKAVIYHNKLIGLCREVESIFSSVLLLNLVASSLLICLLIFSVTVSPASRIVKYLIFLSSSLSQIFMMSWYGNKLIEESGSVGLAAYSGGWPSAGLAHRRGILMLQARVTRTLAISAMGFSNISLATFTSILSASWSYFTLLRSVYQKTDKKSNVID